MNKGIIIEKHLKYSIVLTRDGSFEKAVILESEADVGEEVFFKRYRGRSYLQKWKGSRLRWPIRGGVLTALITLLIICASYFTGENKTYAYITIDINPSIDIQVDRDTQVQNISPMNKEAEKLLSKLPADHETDLYAVIDEIMNICDQDNLASEKRDMLVGISYADDKHQAIENKINNAIPAQDTNWDIISFNIPPEIRQRALENNTSMNEEFAIVMSDDENTLDREINIDQLKMERIYSFYDEQGEGMEEEQTEPPTKKQNESPPNQENKEEIRHIEDKKSADKNPEKEKEIKASTTDINAR